MAASFGFVYALKNECMPGIYKIGFTTHHPMIRVDELSRATACPMPFELLAYFGCREPHEAERKIHERFDKFRVNQSREFFRMSIHELRNEFRGWVTDDVFYSDPMDTLCFQLKKATDPVFARQVRETVEFIANGGAVQ